MTLRTRQPARDVRYDTNAWIALIVAVLLIAGSGAQLAYRFTLPTDGWSVITTELDQSNWVFWENLVGAPSNLRQFDEILEVDDQSVVGTASMDSLPAPAHWQLGQTVQMTVRRDGQELTVDVPVVHWSLGAFWRRLTSPDTAVSLVGALVLAFIGFFTFSRRPELPSARALLILCSAFTANTISGLLPDGLSVGFNAVAFLPTSFFSYAIFGIVLAPSLMAFTLHFPHTKQVIQRHKWLGYGPALIGLLIAATVFGDSSTAIVGWLGTMGMTVASIASLIHSGFTQRDAVSRAQLRWAIGGFVVGLACFLLVFPSAFGWIADTFWAGLLGSGASLGFTVIGVSLAIAVLRYRLFDIDLIIRRTLIYGAVTILLALVYFGGVALLQSLFSTMTGEQSSFAVVISTLAIAALFTPLRNRVQRFVDRRFYRQKYDAEQTLEAFSQTMRDEVDLEHMTVELVNVVNRVMQPQWISLWLQSTTNNKLPE